MHRPTEMDHRPEEWPDQLRHLWADRIGWSWPARFVLVVPEVAPSDDAGHILVIQHEHALRTRVSPQYFLASPVSGLDQLTCFPHWLLFDQLLAFHELQDECRRQVYLCLGFVWI